ncbi:MAG TPA: response regulator transcription factor, partial [Actinomycetota bacterium]|nr:response regulator transcription factor [Actinomycetota bacterium]
MKPAHALRPSTAGTILVVDDEAALVEAVRARLMSEGYDVRVAADGPSALAQVQAERPDLVVLDLMLPGLGGTELLQRIRRRTQQVPILVLTAREATEEKVRNFEAGADDYLTKPFAFAELVIRVKALLRRGPVPRSSVLRVADLELDRLTQQVRRGGRRIELT